MQDEVVARAKSAMAIQKLVPLGEYLDLADGTTILQSRPSRYQALATTALDIIRTFRDDQLVRDTCQDSSALLELLQNVDFEVGAGVLAKSRLSMSN